PAFINTFTELLKHTTLLSGIGVAELTYRAYTLGAQTFHYVEFLTAIAAAYFAIIFPLSLVARHAEARLVRRTGQGRRHHASMTRRGVRWSCVYGKLRWSCCRLRRRFWAAPVRRPPPTRSRRSRPRARCRSASPRPRPWRCVIPRPASGRATT